MERNYEAERLAQAITNAARPRGANGFRVEFDERTNCYWIQPGSNGAILTTGESAVDAAKRFLAAGQALHAAAVVETEGEHAKWAGGRVYIEADEGGYSIYHEPELGGRYPVDWQQFKIRAVAKAKERAEQFNARLFYSADCVTGI